MPVSPTGPLSEPLAGLRELIAGCTAFQTWVGAADATEALDYIHLLTRPKGATLPNVLIDFGDMTRDRDAITNGRKFQTRKGSNLVVFFRAAVADDAEEPDASLTFANAVGAVWLEMETKAGVYANNAYACDAIELVVAPIRIEVEQRDAAGDYFECAISPFYTRTAA